MIAKINIIYFRHHIITQVIHMAEFRLITRFSEVDLLSRTINASVVVLRVEKAQVKDPFLSSQRVDPIFLPPEASEMPLSLEIPDEYPLAFAVIGLYNIFLMWYVEFQLPAGLFACCAVSVQGTPFHLGFD